MELVVALVVVVGLVAILRTRKRRPSGGEGSVDYSSEDEPRRRERLSADGRQRVAGEGHYQQALREVAGGRSVAEGDFDNAVPVEATLVPEPRNPYDANAVRVEVGGRKVGYLPGDDAPAYGPALRMLWQRGALGTCPGWIMGGGRRHYGIYLSLGAPQRVAFANASTGLRMLEADRLVSVTRCKDHQDALERVTEGVAADEAGLLPPFAFELAESTVSTGKYAGQRCVEVRCDSERIGELTRRMSERYLPLLDSDDVVGCEGLIRQVDEGLEVKVRLPKTVPSG